MSDRAAACVLLEEVLLPHRERKEAKAEAVATATAGEKEDAKGAADNEEAAGEAAVTVSAAVPSSELAPHEA